MAEIASPLIKVNPHLRILDARRDLMAVANLIETCFAATMDPDGREYLRQMRQTAQDDSLYHWGAGLGGGVGMSGYVWEEDGVVVGNLTLIPMYKQLQRVYLIANVAVHPQYRRRGIARMLTGAALQHAQRNGAASAWLQVRAENQPATQLYLTMGFYERSRRTNWFYDHNSQSLLREPGVAVTPRRAGDWTWQQPWLNDIYPKHVAWNLTINLNRLKPGIINSMYRFLMSERIEHLAARNKQGPLGMISWEPTHTYADTLWLATTPEFEDLAVRALLPAVRRMAPTSRPLILNYPFGRALDAFQAAGLQPQQTLIWMEKPFEAQPISG